MMPIQQINSKSKLEKNENFKISRFITGQL